MCLDGSGHVFFAGHFNGTADFDPGAGTANLTSGGSADLFIARYDAATGAYETAVRIGSAFNDTAPPGTMRCDAGNLYLTGRFRGTLDLNPGPGTNNVTNSGTNDNIWVGSYDANLANRWGFSIASGNGLDGGHRVDFDPTGSGLYVAGWFSGVTDFDGGTGTYNLTSMNNAAGAAADTFIAKYNKDTGAFIWARGMGGTVTDQTQISITAGLAVDDDGSAYVTGQFFGTNATFYDSSGAQSGSPTWNSLGNNDGYLIKYAVDGSLWQPTQLDNWRQAHFTTMANTGTAADHADADGDGIANLFEYATGTSPIRSSTAPLTTTITGNRLTLTATKSDVTGVTWGAESCDDLFSWSSASVTVLIDNTGTFQARDSVSASPGVRRFLRLKVTRH